MRKVEINELRIVDAGGFFDNFVWGDAIDEDIYNVKAYGYVDASKMIICAFVIDTQYKGVRFLLNIPDVIIRMVGFTNGKFGSFRAYGDETIIAEGSLFALMY